MRRSPDKTVYSDAEYVFFKLNIQTNRSNHLGKLYEFNTKLNHEIFLYGLFESKSTEKLPSISLQFVYPNRS